MLRCYCRRLCTFAVLLMLLVMLASYRQQTHHSMQTSAVTPLRLQPNITNQTKGIGLGRPFGRFFVFSPQCKIPYVDPFAKELLDWEPLKVNSCIDGPSLFGVSYDRNRRHYRVYLNKSVAGKHFASYSPFGCTYTEINPRTDSSSAHSRPINFDTDWIVPSHFLAVVVECHALANTSRVMQRDAFSFVQRPRDRNARSNATRDDKKPSILIFGIDSMSRMNFHRIMPLTSKFVRREGWFEMEGYNSLSSDRLVNLMAILSGRTWGEDLKHPLGLFGPTMMWQRFRNAGYLTAYAEDVTSDYFKYIKVGYPVDFYMRPFLVVLEKVFHAVENLKLCLGRRHRFGYVFDFAKQLIERFVLEQRKPLFGLFWTSSFTQDDFRGGSALDEPFVRYLEKFQEYGLFDRSIVILVSGHGSRQGLLADHRTGFLEQRLPMLHIYLPPWYRKTYPSVVRALELNKNRLSSNCDLYLGIRHFIEQARTGVRFEENISSCQSILEELPKTRSCRDAYIPANWCSCEPFLGVPVTESIRSIASLVVYRMNRYLKLKNLTKECHRMVLDQVLQARRLLHFDKWGKRVASPTGTESYHLKFTIMPSGTTFSSMVTSSADTDADRVDGRVVTIQMEMIKRLGPRSNASHYVDDEMAKRLCICRQS